MDHGKTSLVRALTGINTDRWREEQDRGLTIDIGFARLPLIGQPPDSGLEIGVVDVPGHEDFVKNMLAGATGIDLLLLVIAADEGPMPQTREHLAIAQLLGVRTGVVALTKADRVEDDWLHLAEETVREELRRTMGDAEWPIIPVATLDGTGVDVVREAIVAAAAGAEPRDEGDLLRMPIDRCFTLPGAGTVVTGTVWSGRVSRGEKVRVLPADRAARVRSLEVHGDARDGVGAGRRCALALVGIEAESAGRGATVTSHPTWAPARRIGARIRLLEGARALKDGQRVRVYLGTGEVMARVRLGMRELGPGADTWARLDLEAPLLVRAGDRFILRFLSPVTTIGGGKAAELDPPNRWSGRTGEWERLLDGERTEAVEAAVGLSGRRGLDPARLSIVTGHSAAGTDDGTDWPEAVVECGGRLFLQQHLVEAQAAILSELARVHAVRRRSPGGSLESLRAAVGGHYHPALVQRALADLASEGAVVVEGPQARLPGHEPDLTPEERRRMSDVLSMIEAGGIEPPAVADIRSRLDLERDLLHDVLRLLTARGVVVPITADLYLSTASERSLRMRARELLEREGIAGPAAFKGEFRVSRKYLIPLLEHLDRTGLTRRVEDGRQLVGRE